MTTTTSSNKRMRKTLKSLLELCQDVLSIHPEAMVWLEGIPYVLLKPVLAKLSPKQLTKVEILNEDVTHETDELWKSHCLRDFTEVRRGITDGSLPPPESWRTLYQSKEDEIAEKEAKLSQRLKSIREEQQMAKNAKTAKVIEDPRMKKEALAQKKKSGPGFLQKAMFDAKRSPFYSPTSSGGAKRSRESSPLMTSSSKKMKTKEKSFAFVSKR